MRSSYTRRLQRLTRRIFISLEKPIVALLSIVTLSCSTVAPTSQIPMVSGAKNAQVQQGLHPDCIADPFEPWNRMVWAANQGLLVGFLHPTARAYRAICPPPIRGSIRNFARNLAYPGRLLNHIFQGRWSGAGDESLRFLCNTTVGVAGLLDVATRWNIPKSDADFGQTFSRWGWKPHSFVMLPLLGPSDDMNAVGTAFDKATQPLNYFPPYGLINPGTTYNNLSDQTEEGLRFISSETDSYVGVKALWTYASKDEAPDWTSNGAKDIPTLQSLGVVAARPKDPEFLARGSNMGVRLPSTGRIMKFNYWMQPKHAPIVFIVPGLGSHRQSSHILSLAESIYQNGFSVVTTTGIFHPEFMENASTAALPGYPPTDCHDLLVELTEIEKLLGKKFPSRMGAKALVGASMGGFEALYLAAQEKNQLAGLLRFDRYVAIDTPVDLHETDAPIDCYYNAPLNWPLDERQMRVNNTIHKAVKLSMMPPSSTTPPPFDAAESQYLVGLSFRITLRDTIYFSQSRQNMGILQAPLLPSQREESYREIMDCSFGDYFSDFLEPYYQSIGIQSSQLIRQLNLRTHQVALRNQKKIRIIVNRNDFLLEKQDVSWLEKTFPPSRLKIFPDGGHMGNIASDDFKKELKESLSGLN